jgi:tetratricopeptide (TPR) repeat protein
MHRALLIVAVVLPLGGSALADSSPSVQHMNAGMELMKAKRLDDARHEFDEAIDADPSNHEALFDLGLLREAKGEWPEAAEIALDPAGHAEEARGWLLYDLGRYGDAIAAEADGVTKVTDPTQRADLEALAGASQLALGKPVDAARALDEALADEKGLNLARLELAVAHGLTGAGKAASAEIDDAAKDHQLEPIWIAWARRVVADGKLAPSATKTPGPYADGSHTIGELRFGGGAKLVGQKIKVRGFLVWAYDCAQIVGPTVAREHPEECEKPYFYLGDSADAWPDKLVWVVGVPRALRDDEKAQLNPAEIASRPPVPKLVVGQEVIVEGEWNVRAPDGFMNTDGLLIYGTITPVK